MQTNYTLTGFVTKKIKKGVEKGIITINKIGLTKSGQAIFTLSGPGGPHATINLNYVGSGKWENLPFGSYTIIEAWPNGNVYKYKTKLSASTEEINATNRYPIIEVINADKIPEDIKNDKEA